MLARIFAIEGPVQHREAPRWDLMIVLRRLMMPPFEPMNMASLADMTRKLAFLLTLALAKMNSEVWAFSADVRLHIMQLPCRFCQALWLKRWIRVSQRPTRLLGRPQPQMYPPVSLNQYTLVNKTFYIYASRPHKQFIKYFTPKLSSQH